MLQSVINDIKAQFRYGNMISRIILLNVFVFLLFVLVKAFSPGGGNSEFYHTFLSWFSLSSETINLLKHPWSLLTHMFLHEGLWHLGWNMIMLYWFGRIVGDLIGDQKILPLYFLGGLAGALFYIIYASISGQVGIAYGASAAVMALIVTSGFLAPEYLLHLILIGSVRLKYVVLVLVLIDLVMISQANNTGGRIAHMGGALMGGLFIYLLRSGIDITSKFSDFWSSIRFSSSVKSVKQKVVHKDTSKKSVKRDLDTQEKIDAILDKINATGYDSLTPEEKEFLFQASKK